VIAGIKSATGKVLYKRGEGGLGRVIDPNAVGMMNGMMHDVFTMGTAKKADISGWELAGKTGTSQEFRDAWFVGYSATLVT
ncbi:penicillin-binding transpeptidase domain-containing protein, partial [Vibrio parahaemolyticus]|uniref:penicillin-binding transpeptidase domain-containing protein n=1 Tax=Vibrio parahaemolyticus TaxID=670 RepID=UPI001AC1A87D